MAVWLAAFAGLAVACDGPVQTIGIGQNIHHDDFEYSVQRVEKLDRIGDLASSGAFVVVTFQVENRAKRVGHEWDNAIAYIEDEQGRVYDNLDTAQKQLDAARPFGYQTRYHTNAGATERTKLVFDLPKTATQPMLRVRGETLMGDVFDGRKFARTRVKLF